MMSAGILKQQLKDSVRLVDKAELLRTAKSATELLSIWDVFCEVEKGDVREALQETYAEVLKSFGAFQG
jgi:hypothetical protein